jgi:hypothetical protein
MNGWMTQAQITLTPARWLCSTALSSQRLELPTVVGALFGRSFETPCMDER